MAGSRFRLATIAIATVLLAQACGSDDDDTESTTVATEAPEATEAPTTAVEAVSSRVDDGGPFETLEEACESAGGLEAADGFRVDLVTAFGSIDDGTFNESAADGLAAALECFGITESDVVETTDESAQRESIDASLESDPDLIVTVGSSITEETEAAAAANPDVTFVGIDQFLPEYPTNMAGAVFCEAEAGYIAGVLAATLSRSGSIGVVAGSEDSLPVVKYVRGYLVGAASVDDEVTVETVFNESFEDPIDGADQALEMIDAGVDVVFGAAGPTGSAAISAAAEQDAYVIGVDQDEYVTTFSNGDAAGSEQIVSSAMKRVDLAVFRMIQSVVDGTFTNELLYGTAENELITYAPSHDADLPAAATRAAAEAWAALASGEIETGICCSDGQVVGEGSACDEPAQGDSGCVLFAGVPDPENSTRTSECVPIPGPPGVHVAYTTKTIPGEVVPAFSAALSGSGWTVLGSGTDEEGLYRGGLQATNPDGRYMNFQVVSNLEQIQPEVGTGDEADPAEGPATTADADSEAAGFRRSATPATDPPATEPPVTDPPGTDPESTDPPATEPPGTDPETTDPSETTTTVALDPTTSVFFCVWPDRPGSDACDPGSSAASAEALALLDGIPILADWVPGADPTEITTVVGRLQTYVTPDLAFDVIDGYQSAITGVGWSIIQGGRGEGEGGSGGGFTAEAPDGRYMTFNTGGPPGGGSDIQVCIWPTRPFDDKCGD